jgi:AMP nucleosidase
MVDKKFIADNWLPRYTGMQLSEFGEYILLTNFKDYVFNFAKIVDAEVRGISHPMQSATKNNITIVNFSMGSAMAATVMDLLTAIMPRAVLFLGKTGSLKSYIGIGELLLPIAAIRGEGTSNDYFPKEVPALPENNR